MCPDPALLVAYLDGTLFHRDAEAIDRHIETCRECTALVASMRERRAAEQASKTSRARMMMAGAIVSVAVIGYGLWVLWPRSTGEPIREPQSVRNEAAPPAPAVSTAVPAPAPAAASVPAPAQPTSPRAPARTAPSTREAPPKPDRRARREAATKPVPKSAPAPQTRTEARRARQAAATRPPRVMWRTREQIVETSNDGGMTWTAEHTADRPIRASVFVSEDVAWVVGDNGLVLRRTKNGWFGASPPAEGNITAVKASSPSKATVTLEDGRVFTTANGGVTWSSAP